MNGAAKKGTTMDKDYVTAVKGSNVTIVSGSIRFDMPVEQVNDADFAGDKCSLSHIAAARRNLGVSAKMLARIRNTTMVGQDSDELDVDDHRGH